MAFHQARPRGRAHHVAGLSSGDVRVFDDANASALALDWHRGDRSSPGLASFRPAAAWNNLGELRLAQQEIARGQFGAAHRRLAALAARPGALGGAADYWLGVCEAIGGRPDAALQAFARLPEGYRV